MRNPEKLTANEIAALMHDQPFCVSHDYIRNIRTLFRRYSNEGLSFLTKTLPSLGKAFDKALSGQVAFSLPTSFKRYKKTCFPHFLGSALRRVLDPSGFLLPSPCYKTVAWLRTVLFYAYKIEVPFEEMEIQEFSEKFIATDEAIGSFPIVGDDATRPLRSLMRAQIDHLNDNHFEPAFGPGISSNCSRVDKYNQFVPPSELRNAFGRQFFHQPNEYWLEELFITTWVSWMLALNLMNESKFTLGISPSKILFVPKDSRGPRTICCEDSRMMYAQKSLQKSLYSQIERSLTLGGYVNFTDQTINQKLTFDPGNATIDLKDASDRISLDIVIDIFPQKLLKLMLASRSSEFTLPDGSIHTMQKFAPMGSALCFPIMALVAYTAVTSGIYLAGGCVPNRQTKVFVYGDDIIVPNEWAEVAMSSLEAIGLLVNRDKSFVNSRFRESCGQDTLDQATVTPIRKKRLIANFTRKRYNGRAVLVDQNNALAHSVSLMNAARRAGFVNLANDLQRTLESRIVLPYGTADSSYLCKEVSSELVRPYNQAEGYEINGKLRALVIRDEDLTIKFDSSYGRLRRCLLEGGGIKPINPLKLGARTTYLQHKSLIPWGTSYA